MASSASTEKKKESFAKTKTFKKDQNTYVFQTAIQIWSCAIIMHLYNGNKTKFDLTRAMKLNGRKTEFLGNVCVLDLQGFINLQDKGKLVRRSKTRPLFLMSPLICAIMAHRFPLHPLCCQRTRRNGGSAAKCLEPCINYLSISIHLDLKTSVHSDAQLYRMSLKSVRK